LVLRYGSTLWTNVLKSVSGFQMYRQFCQPQVDGLSAIDFLLNDPEFPRAVRACMEQAKFTAAALPRSEDLILSLDRVENSLPSPLPTDLDGAMVSKFMDALQKQLAGVHNAVVQTWFLPGGDA
ncbi:MAG: alpha-E domain-containing protein, partial [Woeseia sp.]|nr:alpha-E domain-containing protein [Woeseia sp.]